VVVIVKSVTDVCSFLLLDICIGVLALVDPEMFVNDDDGYCDSPTTPTSQISVKETELKELDGLSLDNTDDKLDIGLLTNPKSSSTVTSLSF